MASTETSGDGHGDLEVEIESFFWLQLKMIAIQIRQWQWGSICWKNLLSSWRSNTRSPSLFQSDSIVLSLATCNTGLHMHHAQASLRPGCTEVSALKTHELRPRHRDQCFKHHHQRRRHDRNHHVDERVTDAIISSSISINRSNNTATPAKATAPEPGLPLLSATPRHDLLTTKHHYSH